MTVSVALGKFAEAALRVAGEVRAWARAVLAVRVELDDVRGRTEGDRAQVIADEGASFGECDKSHAASVAGAA